MAPEAPTPEDRGNSTPDGKDSARRRVEGLDPERADSGSKKTGPDSTSGQGSGGDGTRRPALTEKQRIEARRARQAGRRRPVRGNPVARGLKATGFEIRRTVSFLGGAVISALAALGPVFSSAGMGIVWLAEKAGVVLKALGRLIKRAIATAGRLALAADRVLTPHRALILVAAIGSVLLAVSQFKGLGSIEIGQAGYSGIEDLARAPAIDKTTPAGVHTKILVPIAAIALAAVIVIALGGVQTMSRRFSRWRRLASMVLVTVGLLTLVIALLIDLPDATDTTEAALAYAGVQARLLSGFWLELAAGASLTVTGLALLMEPSAKGVRDRKRQRDPQDGGRAGSDSRGGVEPRQPRMPEGSAPTGSGA